MAGAGAAAVVAAGDVGARAVVQVKSQPPAVDWLLSRNVATAASAPGARQVSFGEQGGSAGGAGGGGVLSGDDDPSLALLLNTRMAAELPRPPQRPGSGEGVACSRDLLELYSLEVPPTHPAGSGGGGGGGVWREVSLIDIDELESLALEPQDSEWQAELYGQVLPEAHLPPPPPPPPAPEPSTGNSTPRSPFEAAAPLPPPATLAYSSRQGSKLSHEDLVTSSESSR